MFNYVAKTLGNRTVAAALALFAALGFSTTAGAFTFEPTDAEFLAWPKYCQVVFTRTIIGRSSKWAKLITRSDEIVASAILGDKPYGGVGVHHYCAAMALLARVRSERDPRKRNFELGRAEANAEYTFDQVTPDHRMFAAAYSLMAEVRYEQGDEAQALELLDEAIYVDAKNAIPYLVKSTILSRAGRYEEARDVLARGDANVGGTSADIQYNLGLALMKLGKPADAAEYAYKAYANHYPLPGLRLQLERAGYWHPGN